LKASYLTIITYVQAIGRSIFGRGFIAAAAAAADGIFLMHLFLVFAVLS